MLSLSIGAARCADSPTRCANANPFSPLRRIGSRQTRLTVGSNYQFRFPMMMPTLQPRRKPMTADEAIARIQALRAVTVETGCQTRRAQSFLLGSLSEAVLTEVAMRITNLPSPKRMTTDNDCTGTL
jgi:hypothetical protein